MASNGMSLLLGGQGVLIVGVDVEPDEPDALRVFVDHRSRGLYFVVQGDDAEKVRRAWGEPGTLGAGGHLVVSHDQVGPLWHACRVRPRREIEFSLAPRASEPRADRGFPVE